MKLFIENLGRGNMSAANERLKQLESVLKSINSDKKYKSDLDVSGDTVIAKLSDKPLNVETISSGSLVLDQILGGGFGKGRIIEVYGAESSGKTSIALNAVANVQKKGGTAVFVDAEHALDPKYATKLGVKIDELAVAQPSTAEQTMDLVQDLASSGVVDIIVIDSVAALVPKRELEGDAQDLTVGELARLLSRQLRKLVSPAARNGCTILFLNQTRDKIGGFSPFGTPQITPGGKALKFFASQRVRITKGQPIKGDKNDTGGSRGTDAIGVEVKFKIEKNKIAPPFGEGKTVLTYNKGINVPAELVEVGADYGAIHKPNNRTYVEVETGEIFGKSKAEALASLENDAALAGRIEKTLARLIQEDLYGISSSQAEEVLALQEEQEDADRIALEEEESAAPTKKKSSTTAKTAAKK